MVVFMFPTEEAVGVFGRNFGYPIGFGGAEEESGCVCGFLTYIIGEVEVALERPDLLFVACARNKADGRCYVFGEGFSFGFFAVGERPV